MEESIFVLERLSDSYSTQDIQDCTDRKQAMLRGKKNKQENLERTTTSSRNIDKWDDVFKAECEHLDREKGDHFAGISLSGGGVRSAIVCMGILEYLAKEKILSKFDYLSSVSGGGYAGAALSFWLHDVATRRYQGPKCQDESYKIDPDTHCPFTNDDDQRQAFRQHVRANINYLMPSKFRGLIAGTYVLVRSILLNVAIWTCIIAMIFWLFSAMFEGTAAPSAPQSFWTALTEFFQLFWDRFRVDPFFAGLLGMGLVLLILAAIQMIVFSFMTKFKTIPDPNERPQDPWWYYAWLRWNERRSASLEIKFKRALRKPLCSPYWGYPWRRANERCSAWLILLASFAFLFGPLPLIVDYLDVVSEALNQANNDSDATSAGMATWFGFVGTIIGIATSVFALFRAKLVGLFGNVTNTLIVVGSFLFVYSILLIAMVTAKNFDVFWLVVLCGLAIIVAHFCNINDVSLGRFYRDRLMEAFLPDIDRLEESEVLARTGEAAETADTLVLTNLIKEHQRPLHLINTNVMAWWSPDSRARRRAGDNFVLSALCSGSDITGWRDTREIAAGKLTLPTAMATSGAAINPHGGFVGTGPTRHPIVAFAMALLGLRLGYWLRWKSKGGFSGWGNRIYPSAWLTLLRLFRFLVPPKRSGSGDRTPGFLELTDGGHFENMGLYELIRRKCRLILICDGGEDPETSYASFVAAIRRVHEDFGAEIKFDMHFDSKWKERVKGDLPLLHLDTKWSSTTDIEGLLPTGPQDIVARKAENQFPREVDYAKKGYFLASIKYAKENSRNSNEDGYRANRNGGSEYGLIVYLKSAMIPSLDVTTKGYSGKNPLFPYDPTLNQFFSPEQFEAYRDVGYKITEQMDRELEFSDLLKEEDFFSASDFPAKRPFGPRHIA